VRAHSPLGGKGGKGVTGKKKPNSQCVGTSEKETILLAGGVRITPLHRPQDGEKPGPKRGELLVPTKKDVIPDAGTHIGIGRNPQDSVKLKRRPSETSAGGKSFGREEKNDGRVKGIRD